jgi:hypothetical protein
MQKEMDVFEPSRCPVSFPTNRAFLRFWGSYFRRVVISSTCHFTLYGAMTSPFFSVVILLSVVALSAQQSPEGTSENITCYDWNGNGYGNNTQCPGSNICCNTANLCNENRFCIENNQTIVPTCAVYPWSDCSNICQYGTFNVF